MSWKSDTDVKSNENIVWPTKIRLLRLFLGSFFLSHFLRRLFNVWKSLATKEVRWKKIFEKRTEKSNYLFFSRKDFSVVSTIFFVWFRLVIYLCRLLLIINFIFPIFFILSLANTFLQSYSQYIEFNANGGISSLVG